MPLALFGALALLAWVFMARKSDAEAVQGGALLLHEERAEGLHPSLRLALAEWKRRGPFPVMVGVKGGMRSALDQLALYAIGRTEAGDTVTNARTPIDTPHGRGAAVDLWPVNQGGAPIFGEDEGALALYREMGAWFQARGFRTGINLGGGRVDWPHIEIPNWQSLPYPPPRYTFQDGAA